MCSKPLIIYYIVPMTNLKNCFCSISKVLKQYLSSYIWKQALPAYPIIHDIWFLVENDKLIHDVHVEVD